MPTYDSCLLCSTRSNRINILISSIFCICIGLGLMFFLNRSNKPIGESISDHPLKLLGILLVVIGSMVSVMICMHCLVSSKSPSETVLTDNNRIYQNQTPDWSILDVNIIQPSATRPSIDIYSLRDFSSVSVPKPTESDLPPSYEEVMASINTSGLSK